ncbi:hypothetical protein D1093_09570 [Bartonella kosoyi]|uniref:Uncharacterized protein n=1 Tax=Bartonella kosoyi TaxID=2133959 RepID=A0A5B9CZA7_9HYPH|nr:hypothetical protein [Bartonella kosoyi]QEE09796.1 hypothetical protein D1093_09570 [Bartonella kosoyi]
MLKAKDAVVGEGQEEPIFSTAYGAKVHEVKAHGKGEPKAHVLDLHVCAHRKGNGVVKKVGVGGEKLKEKQIIGNPFFIRSRGPSFSLDEKDFAQFYCVL